ncbi:MAG: restriction endonuclease subunit R [Bacteroidetes bacterium GWA2_31_9b]|nr:MAG: restriction endonuclease subunit R [Bacteroidetes bacterium GWA2_31_9b]
MESLNLPTYSFNIKFQGQRKYIFDTLRKKYVILTPEEWVRQNFLKFLTENKNYPASLIFVEMEFKLNTLSKRCDAVVFNRSGNPVLIVECKASTVKIDKLVFEQIARYNMQLKVDYLIVTNGLLHYCCKIDFENQNFEFLNDIPNFLQLLK